MWCLGRFLPIIIGDLVPMDDPAWENYLRHLEIIDEVFAPKTTIDRVEYLEMLIEDYLYDFKIIYPERPFTPKMHHLIHISTWIKRYIIQQ